LSDNEQSTRRATLMIVCAAVTFALTFGIRSSQPLFIGPINTATGVGLPAISLAFAVGQLMWGVTQPIAGVLSTRYGNGPVLTAGALMVAAGTALTGVASSPWALIFTIGALMGMGGKH
jgi:MFS family permease